MSNLTDWAWCAGFFDGEGTVSVKHKSRPRRSYGLQAQQNSKESLDFLQEVLGGTVYGPYRRQRSRDGVGEWSNPYWVWRLSRQEEVYASLNILYPYLKVKREEADAALRALQERFGS